MNAENWAQLTLAIYATTAVVAVWWLSGRCEHGRQVWFLYAANRFICGWLYHERFNRRCPFPNDGPAIIVANHRSPADPMLLWMNHHLAGDKRRIRAINFLMAREYYEVPALTWMFRALRSIPVNREAKEATPVREAIRRLQAGELVGIFPEGGINPGEGMMTSESTGAAFLALKSRAPVYPAFIHNSPQGSGMVSSFLRTARVRVIYGDPIDLSAYYDHPKMRDCFEEVNHLLMRKVAELGGIEFETSSELNTPAETLPLNRAAE